MEAAELVYEQGNRVYAPRESGAVLPYQISREFRLSWTQYARWTLDFVVLTAVLLFVGLALARWAGSPPSRDWAVGALLVALSVGIAYYRLLVLRSTVLVINEAGVWLERGVLPWDRGANGVQWRDIGSASFHTGFVPWLTKAFRVVVIDRFDKEVELSVGSVAHGDQAAQHINEVLRRVQGDVSAVLR